MNRWDCARVRSSVNEADRLAFGRRPQVVAAAVAAADAAAVAAAVAVAVTAAVAAAVVAADAGAVAFAVALAVAATVAGNSQLFPQSLHIVRSLREFAGRGERRAFRLNWRNHWPL